MIKGLKYIIMVTVFAVFVYFISNITSSSSGKNTLTMNQENIPSEDKSDKKDKPVFSYSSIPDHIKDKMLGKSMPHDEPLDFNKLSYLTLTYYGFDTNTHIGEMIVDSRVAAEVVDIFKELYSKKYPIEKIKLIDEYDAIDNASMADNNSSSFCYRTIAGTNVVSKHGKGLAIDINPLQNPHVIGNSTSPKEGDVYADRSDFKKGMIQEGDDCYNAFVNRGWKWGGHWDNPDYQHFEKPM